MPRDGTTDALTLSQMVKDPALLEVLSSPEDLSMAPGHEGLRRLAKLLRREMPSNFRWNFRVLRELRGEPLGECGTVGCALGLASVAWPRFLDALTRTSVAEAEFSPPELAMLLGRVRVVASYFEMEENVCAAIFYIPEYYDPPVTPVMVADRIDAFLRGEYGWYLSDPHPASLLREISISTGTLVVE